jgi:hypothetical protein
MQPTQGKVNSLEEWENLYKPIMENDSYKDFHPAILDKQKDKDELYKAVAEKRVWTLIDGDESLWISTGLHWVNRVDVYITEKPYVEEFEFKY